VRQQPEDAKADSGLRGDEAAAGSPGPTGELRTDAVGGGPRPAEDAEGREPGANQKNEPAPGASISLDREAAAHEPVGNDTIRDGTVGGVQGPHHASRGQGQGG
jgi:hypothetical protein